MLKSVIEAFSKMLVGQVYCFVRTRPLELKKTIQKGGEYPKKNGIFITWGWEKAKFFDNPPPP